MAMFSEGRKVWMMGGRDGSGAPCNDVWWFTPGQRCWLPVTQKAPWSPRFGHMACGYDFGGGPKSVQLVVMGGCGRTATNDVWTSRDGVSWKQLPDAPWSARYYSLTAVLNGWIYLFGGFDIRRTMHTDLWAAQMLGDGLGPWQKLDDMIPIFQISTSEPGVKVGAASALNDQIYVVTTLSVGGLATEAWRVG